MMKYYFSIAQKTKKVNSLSLSLSHRLKNNPRALRAFTIVELLIVIVIIAILTAVTVVSYNGITNRAKQTSVQSTVSQAAKKVLAYSALNSDQYPSDLATAGITDTQNLTYTYSNTSTPRTFCLAATDGGYSYYVSNFISSPVIGGCPTIITNLHTNPMVVNNVGFASQTPVGSILEFVPGAGPEGQRTYRVTTTGSDQLRIQFKSGAVDVSAGDQFNYSLYVKASTVVTGVNFEVQYSTGWVKYPTQSITTSWSRVSTPVSIPTGATNIRNVQLLTDGIVNVGTTVEITKIQITTGNTLMPYGDGSSPGWAWSGTPNGSTSFGPAL